MGDFIMKKFFIINTIIFSLIILFRLIPAVMLFDRLFHTDPYDYIRGLFLNMEFILLSIGLILNIVITIKVK
jgi:hypothetical protein